MSFFPGKDPASGDALPGDEIEFIPPPEK